MVTGKSSHTHCCFGYIKKNSDFFHLKKTKKTDVVLALMSCWPLQSEQQSQPGNPYDNYLALPKHAARAWLNGFAPNVLM